MGKMECWLNDGECKHEAIDEKLKEVGDFYFAAEMYYSDSILTINCGDKILPKALLGQG